MIALFSEFRIGRERFEENRRVAEIALVVVFARTHEARRHVIAVLSGNLHHEVAPEQFVDER